MLGRESREVVQTALDALSAHVAVLDDAGRIFLVNRAWREYAELNGLGLPDHGVGSDYLEVCRAAADRQSASAAAVLEGMREVRGGGRTEFLLEYDCHGPEEERWFTIRVGAAGEPDRPMLVVCHEDNTANRMVERRLRLHAEQSRRLTRQFALKEESERLLISSELHDNILQSLALSRIQLDTLERSLGDAGLASDLNETRSLIEQAIADSRALLHELGPPVLHEMGFSPALEWLAARLDERHGVRCEVQDDGDPKPLSDEAKILVFQAVRELLENVARHADASHARVRIDQTEERVHVFVEDDGNGFDTATLDREAAAASGVGLFGLRERFELAGGGFEVRSTAGEGTRVAMHVPASSRGER